MSGARKFHCCMCGDPCGEVYLMNHGIRRDFCSKACLVKYVEQVLKEWREP
jgi:hypothetical protein